MRRPGHKRLVEKHVFIVVIVFNIIIYRCFNGLVEIINNSRDPRAVGNSRFSVVNSVKCLFDGYDIIVFSIEINGLDGNVASSLLYGLQSSEAKPGVRRRARKKKPAMRWHRGFVSV
jgi:hypothetical protein